MIGVCTFAFLGDIGGGELLVVLSAILLLFGGKQLPPIARSLGKMADDLKRASQDFRDQLMNADREIEPAESGHAPRSAEPATPEPDEATPETEEETTASPKQEGKPIVVGKDSSERAG